MCHHRAFDTGRERATMERPGLVLVLLLLAVSGGGIVSTARAADVHTRVELENDRMKLIFLRGKKKATDPVGGIGMTQIVNKLAATQSSFNTLISPMIQVELRSSSDAAGSPPVRIPDGELEFLLLPIEQTVLEELSPDVARLQWNDIPVPGSSQLLQIEVGCKLLNDGKAAWDFSVSVDTGPYFVYAVRGPYLGFKAIGNDSTDDHFLIPMTGGQVVPNPLENGNNFPERVVDEGFVQDAFFTYPGNMMSQFMAYYDSTMGLYLAAEDDAGLVKNLYFNKGAPQQTPDKVRVYTYFTHFNSAPRPAASETMADVEADLRTFDLLPNAGYSVVMDVFSGDWLDATKKYRSWVIDNDVPFILRGTLGSRIDIDEAVKTTTFIIRWGLPVDTDELDWVAEYGKIQQTLTFLEVIRRRYDPAGTVDFEPFMLLSRYALGPDGPTTAGHDDISYPMRVGVPELIKELRAPSNPGVMRVRAVSMNRDTTGIATDAAVLAEGLQKGIMYNPDLSPMLAKATRYRACVASQWLRGHRTSLILQTMADSQLGGIAGFNAVAVTGTGNFCFVCYAPMVDDSLIVDRSSHNHRVGGGNYLTSGWTQLADQIRTGAAAIGTAPLLLGMEHSPETLLPFFVLTGRSFAEPLDDTLDGVFRTIDNATPVALFGQLYHDYGFQPSKPPDVLTAVNAYVDPNNPLSEMLHLRLRYAQIAMDGRILRSQVEQNDPNVLQYVGPVQGLDPALQDEQVFLAAMATLRGSSVEYLVFGEGLREPVITPSDPDDSVSMRFTLFGNTTTRDVVRVVGSAWKDALLDTVGILLVNFSPQNADVTVSFEPSDYGLVPGTSYVVEERIDLTTWQDTGFVFDASQRFISPNLRVARLQDPAQAPPWRIFRVREVTPSPSR
jgi:hypothetical protein